MIHCLVIQVHSRSKGHTAAAGIAYRCASDLVDKGSGELHRYSRGRGSDVIDSGIIGGRFASLQEYADAIEAAEKRRDAQLFRDVVAALPCELPTARQVDLARGWASHLAGEYSTAVVFAVHRPSLEGDERNVHVHVVLPTRSLGMDGRSFAGPKFRHITPLAVKAWHDRWDEFQERAVALAGVAPAPAPERAEAPRLHLGREAVALERAAARRKDRATAKKAGRRYAPVRRSVDQLIAYTGGVSDRGMNWWAEWCRLELDFLRRAGTATIEALGAAAQRLRLARARVKQA